MIKPVVHEPEPCACYSTIYDVPRHPKHNQATSEVEVEVVMVSTLYEKFWYLQVYR